jgi:hypothetical protein
MSRCTNHLIGGLVTALVLAGCGGGDGDGGNGPGGGGGPSAGERSAMAAALNAAAVNAEAAGDGTGVIILQGAAALLQNDLTVTPVNGVSFLRDAAVTVRTGTPYAMANGWAFGVELGLMQGSPGQLEVGVFEGAVVISGPNIAYGFGLLSATPGFVGNSFGAIWQGANAGWAATALTGVGVADSIIGGNCLSNVPAGLGIVQCVPASLRGPGFNISASTPINFPGNTATGSNTMAFGPNRLRGATVGVDCNQTSNC